MASAVAIMDRASFGASTDVIVVVDAEARAMTWIPRDLWCERLGERVNRAFELGGGPGLVDALAEHGFTVAHTLCLRRDAIEQGIDGLSIRVPVREPMAFWYPLSPTEPIEDGRKAISFDPPVEELAGERIHQWIGARYRVHAPGSDLERIVRQQELVAVMLGEGVDFRRFLSVPDAVQVSHAAALEELARVRPTWTFATLGPLEPRRIDGKEVLVAGAG